MRPIRYSTGDRVIRVDGDDNLDPFQEIDDKPRAYQNQPAEGRIPGFGERYDTCGETDPHFCSDCGEPLRDNNGELIEIGRTCWRKDCPRCAPGWAMRRSYGICAKLEDYRKHVASRRGGDSPKFHHVTLIPPYKDGRTTFATNTDDPLDSGYQIAKVILDQLSVAGGMIAYHPYSGTSEDDRGEWKRRLFKGRDWEGDVRDELHYRAHYHAIVVADQVDHLSCKHLYEKTGWVIHRIEKSDSNVSLYGKRDLASAVTYALSHAGVGDEISDTYRYFGDVAQHTASDRVHDQMRQYVRSVAPSTLDIDLGTTTCNRTASDGDAAAAQDYVPRGTATGGSSGGAEASTDSDSDESGPECGGRLVPLEHAESFLDEVQFDSQLKHAYEDWTGSAPAD
jgi:hypothetical protein